MRGQLLGVGDTEAPRDVVERGQGLDILVQEVKPRLSLLINTLI